MRNNGYGGNRNNGQGGGYGGWNGGQGYGGNNSQQRDVFYGNGRHNDEPQESATDKFFNNSGR